MLKLYTFAVALLCGSLFANAQFQLNGTATPIPGSTNCYRLTPAELHKVGSMWSTTPVDLRQNFEINTRLYFGANDLGADGLAFVLQNAGLSAIGLDGGGIGYHGLPGQSFIIEFDTYTNSAWWFPAADPIGDHIGFMSQGSVFHTPPTQLRPFVELAFNIEDNMWHDAIFTWNATTKTMSVAIFGQVYSYTGDIQNTIFGGNPMVYLGFTAATGSPFELSGANPSEHKVCITTPPPPATCGQLRTQTPGGWGAPAQGNNPGSYLHAKFDLAFADLIVGDVAAGKFAKFTTAQAITDYLPAGGPAKVLTTGYTDPQTNDLKNTLVSHLVALTLSVGFDQIDPAFGPAGVHLKDMVIKSGTFANWTVSQFLAEANKVLAGTSTAYTPQQILDVATAINENYVDGTRDNGYLRCPTASSARAQAATVGSLEATEAKEIRFNVAPNPSAGRFEVYAGNTSGAVRIQVFNSNGVLVEERAAQLNAKGQVLSFDLSKHAAGMYMIRLTSGKAVQTQKVIIQK